MNKLSIGVVREIKIGEDRVGLTPLGAKAMKKQFIPVFVQKGAGKGSRFSDLEYINAGAQILSSAKEIWNQADIIIKVKEPQLCERKYLREGLILYNYEHYMQYI